LAAHKHLAVTREPAFETVPPGQAVHPPLASFPFVAKVLAGHTQEVSTVHPVVWAATVALF